MTDTIHFTPDQAAVVTRKLEDAFHALGVLHKAAKTPSPDGLSTELATNVLKVAEFNLDDLGKTLGIETDGAAERAERYANLRQANERVRALEAQLGTAQAPDAVQASLKVMADRLNSWWNREGFGHIRDIDFGAYGCKVKFSCSLFGDFWLTDSPTPISDKERKARWIESLRARGFALIQDDRDWHLEDCDASRQALCALITERLPSARVTSLENSHRRRASSFVLRGVEVFIRDIAELLQLPAEDAAEVA